MNLRTMLLAALTFVVVTSAARAGAPDPVREKNEARLVEILHIMQKKPPPAPEAQKQLGDEYMALLGYFGGFDPKVPPKDPAAGKAAQEKAMAAQGEILGRRDPALRDQLAHDLKIYTCKTKQVDAKATLKSLFTAEQSFRAENDKFTTDLKAAGVDVNTTRYDVVVSDAKAAKFRARATGKADMAGDVWEIDETGALKTVTDACATIK